MLNLLGGQLETCGPSPLLRPLQHELARSRWWDLASAWVLLFLGVVLGTGIALFLTRCVVAHTPRTRGLDALGE